jgi:Predicted periplasmic ligand-binding sensor domain
LFSALASLALSGCPTQSALKTANAPLFASTDSGCFAFDGGGWNPVESQAWLEEPARAEKRSGSYRLEISDSVLELYSNGELKQSYAPESIVSGSTKLTAAVIDSSKNIMAGTDRGLGILYSGASSFISQLPDTVSVNALYLDSGGYLYVASSAGLYRMSSEASLIYAESAALSVYVDEAAGMIYVGTEAGIRSSANGGLSWGTSLAGRKILAIGKPFANY